MKTMIIQDNKILNGKPIIKGTRMSVEIILELLSSGLEINDILKEYEYLNRTQVLSAISYASNLIKKEDTYIFSNQKNVINEIPN